MRVLTPEQAERKRQRDKEWRDNNKEYIKKKNAEWVAANRESRLAYMKRWRAENKEKFSAYQRAWERANPEKVLAKARSWNERNREKRRQYVKAWKAKHPEYNAHSVAVRRSRKRATTAGLTKSDWSAIREIYRQRALRSQLEGREYQVDHIVPLAKGGRHHPSNLQLLLAVDNQRKGARI